MTEKALSKWAVRAHDGTEYRKVAVSSLGVLSSR